MYQQHNNQKIIQVNSSSIIDLKAELYRKQEQVRQKKTSTTTPATTTTTSDQQSLYSEELNKNIKLPKKILEIVQQQQQQQQSDKIKEKKKINDELNNENEEFELELKKSRENLERKAKLYEKLSKGEIKIGDDKDDENILVNFKQKQQYDSSDYSDNDDDEDDKKYEYIDQFGRTKMVTKNELEQLKTEERKQQEKSDESDVEYSETNSESATTTAKAKNIHYQHVRDGEIRDHGVGFFAFSEDENIRQQQMEMLDKLRKETESHKDEKRKLKEKQKKMLKNRLEKIAARKGIKLPPISNDDENDSDDNDDDDSNEKPEKCIRLEEATFKLPESIGPREWDLGKEGVPFPSSSSNRKIYSQEKFNEKIRQERNPEFAPPKTYHQQQKQPDLLKFLTDKISEIRKKS